MGWMLRRIGIGIWAATVWMILAELAGMAPAGTADAWLWQGIWAGAGAFGLGLLAGLLWPVRRELSRGRCVRCGTRIERGQVYCRDHLQATVNEYRDRTRSALERRA